MTEQAQLTFLQRSLDPTFVKRIVTISPQTSIACADAGWRGELIVIERGEVELETRNGVRHLFPERSVLTLSKLPLRALHNNGDEVAVLVAVSRKSKKIRNSPCKTD